MKRENRWNDVELRDNRYNQVIHMVSAAKGAEAFYCTENHTARHESLALAMHLDTITAQVRGGGGRDEGGEGEGKGAEAFYCTENHAARHESLALAMHLDTITAQVRGRGGRDEEGEGEGRGEGGGGVLLHREPRSEA